MEEITTLSRTKYNSIQALTSALIGRAELAAKMGLQTFNGSRNMNEALGYPLQIQFADYFARYKRQDICKAVIDRPAEATWQGEISLIESNKAKDTAFEKAWEALYTELDLKPKFSRADKLASLGKFGILLMGFSDVKTREEFANPVKKATGLKLLYVMPFSEGSAKIQTYEEDPSNKRYGKPLTYSITLQSAGGSNTFNIEVHHSRVIHIVVDPLESDIEGLPVLESLFNRLIDLEKIVGGDAEMYWKGARPGYHGKLDKNYQLTPKAKEELATQIAEYEHNLSRILLNEGIDLNSLAQQVSDPKTHVEVQMQMISAVTGIPFRILSGSERGELASGQDADEWDSYVQNRRDEFAGPSIVKAFADRLIELGILIKPVSGKYNIKWSDLFAESEKERVEIGAKRATALKDYSSNPAAQAVVPPRAFFEFFLGFDDDQNELITKMMEEDMNEETKLAQEIEQNDQMQQQQPNQMKRTK